MQLQINIASHPLIKHWSGILENHNNPGTILRTACSEIGKWITYEIMREWLVIETISLEPEKTIDLISSDYKYIIVIIMPYGFILAEGARALLPTANIALVSYNNNIEKIEDQLDSFTKILVLDLFLNEIIISTILEELVTKGALLKNIKIACLECGSSELNKLGKKWSALEIYTTKVNNIINNNKQSREQIFKDKFFV
uniref:uracil phosphoribosyltransferase n=1 Tax=Bangia atropurpurea TaxID=31347 RepID=UPI001FCD9D0C|nr:uracil phosphoribosyltransferase [Bangia atropurpurea]UNJ18375.1 uracil phosphoribosyltransferase [Bangia atropurpurea]